MFTFLQLIMPNHLVMHHWRNRHAAQHNKHPAAISTRTHGIRRYTRKGWNAACHSAQLDATQEAGACNMQPNQSIPITVYTGTTKETQRGTDLGVPGGDCDAEAVAVALMSRPCRPSPNWPHNTTGKISNVIGQFLLKCRLAW